MTLHIELSSQTEAKLRERAAASGKDLGSYALDAIEQKLAAIGGEVESAIERVRVPEGFQNYGFAWKRTTPRD